MFFVTPQPTQPPTRRGAILLVVITMLVLFAAVALAFVYYASSEGTASRSNRESNTAFRADDDPELLMAYFLGKLIYGDTNDATGVYSGLRGHDLARGAYGYADYWDPTTQTFRVIAGLNTQPFNGLGRVHDTTTNPFTVDDYNLINYTYYPGDNFLRDPEHSLSRPLLNPLQPGANMTPYVGGANPPYTYCDLNTMCLAAVNAKGEVLMQSYYRPWTTYQAGQTTNLLPLDPSDPKYGNWTTPPNPALKYQTLRPMPWYHSVQGKTSLPPPEDGGGDVKNGEGLLGVRVPGTGVGGVPAKYYNNDSIWIDIGFPVLTAPDGRKYKPLFAALVVDLDGKINLNAAGNIRGLNAQGNPIHVSNMGWGVWEVSIARALTQGQWPKLFTGSGKVPGRYGPDGQPSAAGTVGAPGEPPHIYGQVDYDATDQPAAPPLYQVPLPVLRPGDPNNGNGPAGTNGLFAPFLYYPPTTYGNGNIYERKNHPLIFNAFTPAGDDRVFQAREMEALLRFPGTGTPAFNSDLFSLCPLDFALVRPRLLTTTHSFDFSAPGAYPWLWQTGNVPDPQYQLVTTQNPPVPQYVPLAGQPPTPAYAFPPPPVPPAIGEFQTLRRAVTATLGRVNLNQTLPAYPLPDPTTGVIDTTAGSASLAQFTAAQQARQNLAQDLFNRLCWATTGQPAPSAATLLALNPKLTPTATAAQAAQYAAYRWLAQLAVNIVDYRDSDNFQPPPQPGNPPPPQWNLNYHTPFNWDHNYLIQANLTPPAVVPPGISPPDGWVYGVELSQVLINEAFAEIDNDPNDAQGATNFLVKFWVELHNPLLSDPSLADPFNSANAAYNGAARLSLPPALINPASPYPPYRIVIAQGPQASWGALQPAVTPPALPLTDPGNSRGDVPAAAIKAVVQNWAPPAGFTAGVNVDTTVVKAANGAYLGTNGTAAAGGSEVGFFVVGPNENFPLQQGTPPPANYPYPTLKLQYTAGAGGQVTDPVTGQPFTNGLTYSWPATTPVPGQNGFYHTLVLQRLACPYLPFNNTPFVLVGGQPQPNPVYNPYITVDYVDSLPTYDGRTMVAGAQNMAQVPITQRAAWGRKQPYAAFSDIKVVPPAMAGGPFTYTPVTPAGGGTTDSQVLPQNPDGSATPPTNPPTPYPGEPAHTFFRANGVGNTAPPAPPAADPYGANETLAIPFDWMTHIDRQLVNPMELLSVSACTPSQVTQLFMSGGTAPAATTPFSHLAPWRNQNTRLYRFLEFVGTDDRAARPRTETRWAGKININTFWDLEILDGLLDAQQSSYWPTYAAPNNVTSQSLLQSLLQSRTPGGIPGPTDRPFLPLSAPVIAAADPVWTTTTGVGIGDTVLRPDLTIDPTGAKPLFGVSPTTQRNPYLQNEILQKIFSNITTRSNVFAVWVTVGFFEVTDDTVRPVKLGAEIGRAEGRNVRHRMFAVIDRSSIAAPSQLTTVTAQPTPQTLKLAAVTGTATAGPPVGVTFNWAIQPGSVLTVGTATGQNQETVTVTAVAGNTITANFTLAHNATEVVSLPGPAGPAPSNGIPTVLANPGPQVRYDPRANSAVVLHFSIID
jgi:hypothetical protein